MITVMENNMEENDLFERLKKRFKKENNVNEAATPPSTTPKKSLLEIKRLIEAYCDEEDRKARELWLKAIETEDSIFYNLTEYSALAFLEKINRNLERKYDEGMLLVHIDPDAVLAKYEKLVKILRRDDLLDILEKYVTLDA